MEEFNEQYKNYIQMRLYVGAMPEKFDECLNQNWKWLPQYTIVWYSDDCKEWELGILLCWHRLQEKFYIEGIYYGYDFVIPCCKETMLLNCGYYKGKKVKEQHDDEQETIF